jgi:hypothetical protein
MEKFHELLILAAAGLLVTAYKVLKSISEGVTLTIATIVTKVLLSLIISLLIVPKIMIYFSMDIYSGLTVASVINLFSEGIMKIAEKKVLEKVEEKLDKHL